MIDSKHHVQINGVNYRLAEDAEGQHYILSGEPLRPPNAVMVQGEGRQDKFQARPDMLLWNITDWSGGEGQIVFDPQAFSRHAILQSVEPFEAPGKLSAGYYIEDCTDSVPATLSLSRPLLVRFEASGTSKLALFSGGTAGKWWIWDDTNKYFGAQSDYTGTSAGARHVVSDENQFYLGIGGATQIYTLALTGGAASSLVSGTIAANDKDNDLALVGDYLYQIDWTGFTVYEIDKSSGAVTTIDTADPATHSVDVAARPLIARGPNRLYVALPDASGDTTVREIIPTSAAGPGYGREIARYPSFWATALWYHQGTLFIGGAEHPDTAKERALLYHVPGGQYGALGRPRAVEESAAMVIQGGNEAARLTDSVFLIGDGALGLNDNTRVYKLDTLSGGYAEISRIADAGMDAGIPYHHKQDIFFGRDVDAGTGGVYRMDHTKYIDGYAITPWHNMGLSGSKILSSLVLSCEALPADWSIVLSYAVDGSDSYTVAGTYTTTSGTGTKYAISTDTATKQFRSLRVKIALTYTGGGTPTTTPVVLGVEVRAQVAETVPVWQLLLDLSDDHSGGSQSFVGSLKYSNIKTAGDTDTVIDFRDGYYDRNSGVYTAYDVVVDAYKLVLDRAGEGVAMVTLRQVA